jgi:hypothetical protein
LIRGGSLFHETEVTEVSDHAPLEYAIAHTHLHVDVVSMEMEKQPMNLAKCMCKPRGLYVVGSGRWEMGWSGRWDGVGDGWCGSGWQGSWVRFPTSEVKFDFLFILLFHFVSLAGICFACVFFYFLLTHHISICSAFHLSIFSYLHIFICSYLHICISSKSITPL